MINKEIFDATKSEYKLWEEDENSILIHYYPAKEKKSDAAIVIFPGGAYAVRAAHEGVGYAEHFMELGVDSFVVDYRVTPDFIPLPLLDARRAVRFIRYYAEKFGIDKNKIAIMGSSAGGHLSALVSTYTAPIEFENLDEIDAQPALPNATILCYPVCHCPDELNVAHEGSFRNLLGEGKEAVYHDYSCDELVCDTTPPAFLWHTSDDSGVNVINSYLYASALRRHNIPHEMHIFPVGPHGLGLAPSHPHVAQWAPLMRNWLAFMGWL